MSQEAEKLHIGPKPWKDISDAERIERLRMELDGWRRAVAQMRDRLTLLESHQHAATGAVVVDLQQADRIHQQSQFAGAYNLL